MEFVSLVAPIWARSTHERVFAFMSIKMVNFSYIHVTETVLQAIFEPRLNSVWEIRKEERWKIEIQRVGASSVERRQFWSI